MIRSLVVIVLCLVAIGAFIAAAIVKAYSVDTFFVWLYVGIGFGCFFMAAAIKSEE